MTETDPEPLADAVLTWERANLHPDRAAALLALGDGLAAIGKLRTGRRAGQLSIFNFRLRAVDEEPDAAEAVADGENAPRASLVVLMRAGVMRRHTFFCRYSAPAPMTAPRAGPGTSASDVGGSNTGSLDMGVPGRLALPGPIDRDWDWWPAFKEVRDRIIGQPAWLEAVGAPYAERLAAFTTALTDVRLVASGTPA